MNIATRIFFIFLIILGLLSAIVVSMNQLADSRKQSTETTERLYKHHLLADQLRQTSDNLTRMARTYVITGDAIYEQYFYEILAIRDGRIPRPENYSESYWDFVTAKEENLPAQARPVALIDLMKQAGIKDQDLVGLKKAKEYSDELAKMERIAFGAMKGLFTDKDGKLTIKRDPDPDFASEVLHSSRYYEVKAEIMHPIKEFHDQLYERIGLELSNNKIREGYYRKITYLLIGMTILFSLLTFLYFRRTIINPIITLSNVAKSILSGELQERAPESRMDEIGSLNKAFNKMIEARILIEFKLKNNERGLRTTLNSIGDALVATDIYGNITRMNPVAEKLTGWQMNEAKGNPLTSIFHIINTTTKKIVDNPVNTVLRIGNAVALANHTTLIARDGTEHQIADSAAPIRDDDGDITGVVLVFRDVTEEYAIQEALHKSEERFKRLFEYAEVAICNEDLSGIKIELDKLRDEGVTDIRKYLENNKEAIWRLIKMVKIIHVNKATLKLFNSTSNSEFIHQFDQTFGPNAINIFADGVCAIWDKKEVFRAVSELRTLDGKIINAIISYPIPETLDGFKNIPVSIIDITELKKTETKLRESEELLSLHLKNTPLGVISWDRNFNCLQWNPAAEKIFGFSQEEALGKHAVELMVPEGMNDKLEKILKDLLNQTGGTHDVSKNVTKEGRVIDCEWFNTPLVGADGKVMGIASMVQDITKHKIAENELRKVSRAVEQSPSSIIITDTDGIIEYVNPKFEESTGYTAKEVIGRNPRFLKSDHTSEKEYTTLWDTIKAGKKWRGEFQNKRKDGSLFWELAFISPIMDEDGTVTHFLAAKEDITERKQLEGHLRKSQKMEAVGELAGGIAHDFNNLLGIIIGNLDLMKRKVEDGSKLQKQLKNAQNAALRGSSLTRRLLNFSHQAPEIGSPADINKIIRSLEDLVGKSLTSKISLDIDLADDLWMVELNTGDFEDMLINFSLNARDAMPNGGRLIVETRNKIIADGIIDYEENFLPGEYVELTISDTGNGIPKEIVSKIFDPFFTTKEKDKGTGLGLSMVYGFIQRTKGYISVYSEKDMGTTFKIYLPRSQTMAERMQHPAKVKEVLPKGTETILIVDDEEELTFIAKLILEELGYTAICAYNSDDALEILENNNIDLLFSDIVMAGSLNGFNLAEIATKSYPALKILLTSGFAGKMQTSEEMEKWGKKMIAKPYRNVELANRVRKTLDEKD